MNCWSSEWPRRCARAGAAARQHVWLPLCRRESQSGVRSEAGGTPASDRSFAAPWRPGPWLPFLRPREEAARPEARGRQHRDPYLSLIRHPLSVRCPDNELALAPENVAAAGLDPEIAAWADFQSAR